VARDLGIHKEALRPWVRQAEAEADAGERGDRLTTVERDELKELRREVAELRRANEILKGASVFFAQEIDGPRTRPSWGYPLWGSDRPPARRLRGRSPPEGAPPVCRVLHLSPSTYFARKVRPKSARRLPDEELTAPVTAVREDSGRTYGARRITRARTSAPGMRWRAAPSSG
jgi:transposase